MLILVNTIIIASTNPNHHTLLSIPPPLNHSTSQSLYLSILPPLNPSSSQSLLLSIPPPLNPSSSQSLFLSIPPPLNPSSSQSLLLSIPPLNPSSSQSSSSESLFLSIPLPLNPSSSQSLLPLTHCHYHLLISYYSYGCWGNLLLMVHPLQWTTSTIPSAHTTLTSTTRYTLESFQFVWLGMRWMPVDMFG